MLNPRYIQLLAGALVLGLLAGCGSTPSASTYLSRAEQATNCSSAVSSYSNAIDKEIDAGKTNSQKVTKAVAGIKAVVPGCNAGLTSVDAYLTSTLWRLAKAKHPEAEVMANVYFDFVNRNPSLRLGIASYEVSALYTVNRAQGRQLLELALERGIWRTGEGDQFAYGSIPKELSQDYRPALERLSSNLYAIEAELKVHDSSECHVSSNFSVDCLGDSDRRLKSKENYYRTYAQAARRVGDGRRANIAEQLVATLNQEFAARLAKAAEDEAHYERMQAQRSQRVASSGANNALLGGLLQAAGQVAQATGSGPGYESGLLMQGVGAVLTGDNAAQQQAITSAQAYSGQSAGVPSRLTGAVVGEPVLATATDECLRRITQFGRPCREPNSVYKPSVQTQCIFTSPLGHAGSAELINKCGYDVTVFVCYKDGGSLQPCREDYGGGRVFYPTLKSNEQSYTVYPARPMRLVVCKHVDGEHRYNPNIVFYGSDFKANCIASNWDGKY